MTAAGAILVTGVPVDDIDMGDTVDTIEWLVADSRRTGRTHQVATVNVDFVVNALREPELAELLRDTALSIPDGMPLVWGARLLGGHIGTRVAGADLVPELAARSASTGLRLSLFGAGPGTAAAAAELLRERYPGCDVVADQGPEFRDLSDLTIDDLAPLAEQDADVCCVAFGNPKQERFIRRFQGELGIPVMMGVGGTLDFLVGEKRRAPEWMQRSGLEWLHRAATEPRRLAGRYARDAWVFLPSLAHQAWRHRSARRLGAPNVDDSDVATLRVRVGAATRIDNRTAHELVAIARRAHLDGREIALEGAPIEAPPGLVEVLDRSAR